MIAELVGRLAASAMDSSPQLRNHFIKAIALLKTIAETMDPLKFQDYPQVKKYAQFLKNDKMIYFTSFVIA